MSTPLPYSFDLHLDCKNLEQLQEKYDYAKNIIDSIEWLLEEYPTVHIKK